MNRFFLILCIPLLSSCAASLDSVLNKSDANAPVNEINGGIVSYLNQGSKTIIKKRRADAYKKMYDYCCGPYKILQEYDQNGAGIATDLGTSSIYSQESRTRIKFECVH